MAGSKCDVWTVLGFLVVFILPISLLIPNFSICNVLPKVRVTRFHVVSQELTWNQLNSAMVLFMVVFFCLYLEIRKRKMDDMVQTVLTVSQATEKTLEDERERQIAAVRACVELLDASADHYEHLTLLREELRCRKQHPPTIEPSCSTVPSSPICGIPTAEEFRAF